MADKEKETKHTDEAFTTSSPEAQGAELSKSDSENVSSEDLGGAVVQPPDQSGPDYALDGLLTTIDGEITKFLHMVNESSSKEMKSLEDDAPNNEGSELGFSSVKVDTEPEDEGLSNDWADASTEMLETFNKEYEEIDLNDLVAAIDEEIEHAPEAETDTEAQPFDQKEGQLSVTEQQFIIFTLAGTEYAVSAANVTEVGEMLQITPLPNVPVWLKGVSNLRGDIISIVDLRSFLQLESGELSMTKRLLITRAGDQEVVVGLVVDKVNAIRYLPTGKIEQPTGSIEDALETYLQGVLDYEERMLTVLDFEKLLLSDEMQQFRPV